MIKVLKILRTFVLILSVVERREVYCKTAKDISFEKEAAF